MSDEENVVDEVVRLDGVFDEVPQDKSQKETKIKPTSFRPYSKKLAALGVTPEQYYTDRITIHLDTAKRYLEKAIINGGAPNLSDDVRKKMTVLYAELLVLLS